MEGNEGKDRKRKLGFATRTELGHHSTDLRGRLHAGLQVDIAHTFTSSRPRCPLPIDLSHAAFGQEVIASRGALLSGGYRGRKRVARLWGRRNAANCSEVGFPEHRYFATGGFVGVVV